MRNGGIIAAAVSIVLILSLLVSPSPATNGYMDATAADGLPREAVNQIRIQELKAQDQNITTPTLPGREMPDEVVSGPPDIQEIPVFSNITAVGWYKVNCNVDGANVYFDNTYEGVITAGVLSVPVYSTGIPFKTYTVSKPGYTTWEKPVPGVPGNGETIQLYATLNQIPPNTVTFTGIPTYGNVPLTVQFTDDSTSLPILWSWDFGDGSSSTLQNPSHTYTNTGTFTVSLMATNSAGSNTFTRANYITVDELYVFVTKWGTRNPDDGWFLNPQGVAVDSSDNVYVADTSNNRVQKFSSTGTYLAKWGTLGSGDGQFQSPVGVAVDSSDNVYVADTSNNRIQKFSSDGTFLAKWGASGSGDGQFQNPLSVTVDSSGNVFVADYGNNRIQKFSSTGTFLIKWGLTETSDGNFKYPLDVAVDSSDNVYVADYYNYRIQKFNSTGIFLTKWGLLGSGDGQFNDPAGVAVNPSGNVYIADSGNSRIQKFGSDGTFLAKWGSSGSGNGQFSSPQGVAVDPSGNVYIADSGNSRIQKFGSDGTF